MFAISAYGQEGETAKIEGIDLMYKNLTWCSAMFIGRNLVLGGEGRFARVEERHLPHFEGVVATVSDDGVVPHFYAENGVALSVSLPFQDRPKGIEVCERYPTICVSF